MQGAKTGGERTAAAAGLTELRYSSKNYEALALELKQDFEATDIQAFKDIKLSLEDMAGAGFDVSAGHLEIWVSN